MQCVFKKYNLHFKEPGGTSRGVLYDKLTYFLILKDNGRFAIGECNLFKGLSSDDREGYEEKLLEVCNRLPSEKEKILADLIEWPSIAFGVETLLRDWKNGCRRIIFPEAFSGNTFSVPVNGLIWMGTEDEMLTRIDLNITSGFKCVKLKIGAIDFQKEINLIQYIRSRYDRHDIEIRLDVNGAFSPDEALEKIKLLHPFRIKYIEQPIRAGQLNEMAALIKKSPIPIALDEELIGKHNNTEKEKLIEHLRPEVLILKPALTGGFGSCDFYRKLMNETGGYCVVTSALESNIGLNAIAQYTAILHPKIPQGLGTGKLFTNNIPSPYLLNPGVLQFSKDHTWDIKQLL